MTPFLQHVANDIYDKKGGDFQHTTIVFPNKRATLFFNQYLWEKAEGQTMWTPEYTTISELFSTLSHRTVAEPVQLICLLYKVFMRHFPATEKSFDELYPLLEMMLADFQDVDSNLVPAKMVFRNIAELQEMSDYSFLEEEQVKAIEHFFNGLKWEQGTTEKKRFTTLWDKLLGIYNDFRQALLEGDDRMVYEGMMKRQVIEDALSSDEPTVRTIVDRLTSTTYAFVGFNVLNKAERELFKFIKRNREAIFYWDYDLTYCSIKAAKSEHSAVSTKPDTYQRGFEAGMFILENIRDFGNAFAGDSEIFKNMAKPKRITLIQSPTENAQSRYINEWGQSHIHPGDTLRDSAIVLCNENLLQPVLHSIPNKVTDGKSTADVALNVTMGYPLSETPAFSLVQALLELQLRGRTRHGAWRYKQVSAVLKHPYIRRMSKGTASKTLIALTESNTIFPTEAAFGDDVLLRKIFTKRSNKELTRYLAEILANAAEGFGHGADKSDFDAQLYKESTFVAYTAINQLHTLQEKMPELAMLTDSTTARLITQTLQRQAIPFHGEPANGLQVMGFLETRNLDFRNVIMLSAGEGQMPRANKRPSLIPYSLQSAFGMTTIDKEVSIYAYYFYRLLQRAESITVLWNSSTDGGHKGEMSRFLLQLMVEAEQIFATGQKIELVSFATPSESMQEQSITVEKTENILQALRDKYDINSPRYAEWQATHDGKQRFLSPSAILSYMKCPLQFFFKYVAGLRQDDEVSDDVDDALFGSIFHYVMEQLYRPFTATAENSAGLPLWRRAISSSQIKAMAEDKKRIMQLVDEGFAVMLYKISSNAAEKKPQMSQINYSGSQLIKHHVLRKLITMQLEADADTAEQAEQAGGSLTILATEEEHSTQHTVSIYGQKPFTVLFGGIIDRIDMVDNGHKKTIRVVDYKTASTPHNATNILQLFETEKVGKTSHITQTMYYCHVLTHEGRYGADTLAVVPAIMYYKNNKEKASPVVKLYPEGKRGGKKPPVTDYARECESTFMPLMSQAVEQIFSPGEFAQCKDSEQCKWCDFATLCNRKTD